MAGAWPYNVMGTVGVDGNGDPITFLQRPSNLTAYVAGSLILPAAVNPYRFTIEARGPEHNIEILGARLFKSGPSDIGDCFRLHLFDRSPTMATAADRSSMKTTVASDGWIGSLTFQDDVARFTDGAGYCATPDRHNGSIYYATSTPKHDVYGLLEAVAAYQPSSAELFEATLEVRAAISGHA